MEYDGLFQCFLGGRHDLCLGADSDGKDKASAGTYYGTVSLYRSRNQFFGWYEPFVGFAGAGASVPLLGYGNILMKGVREAVDQSGFIGLFQGGFKTGAVGCSAALVFGYLASVVFKPKPKK